MSENYAKIVKNSGFLPARMDAELTAVVLGFNEHDIPVLVNVGQLEPLGKPMPNARKYFARKVVLEVSDNPTWLSKATKAIYQHWQEKNANRGRGEFSEAVNASMN